MKHFLFIVLIALAMVGCASTRPTSTQSSSHNQEHTNTHSSKEYVMDSTLIDRLREVIVRNDTVYIHDSICIYKWRDRQLTDTIHDTLYINNTDTIINTIKVEVEKPVYIDKPISPFVRNSCIALWSLIGVAILALVGWIVWNFATGKVSLASLIAKLFSVFIRK